MVLLLCWHLNLLLPLYPHIGASLPALLVLPMLLHSGKGRGYGHGPVMVRLGLEPA